MWQIENKLRWTEYVDNGQETEKQNGSIGTDKIVTAQIDHHNNNIYNDNYSSQNLQANTSYK